MKCETEINGRQVAIEFEERDGHVTATVGERRYEIDVVRPEDGAYLLFTNDDEFLHQIYVDSSLMNFDSDEQPPGQTISVRFPVRGTFPVRCHIHPKMLLTVQVQ